MKESTTNISTKKLIQIAFPIIFTSAAQNIITSTDTIFLGRYGENELAAIGLIGLFFLVINMMGFGLARGAQIFIARRYGERKFLQIGKIFINGMYITLSFAILATCFVQFYGTWFIQQFIKDKAILNCAFEFMQYRKYGIIFSFLNFSFVSLYTGITRTRVLILATSIVAIINIIFNYLLVFGNGGFPAMGIGGSALASSIADIIGFISIVILTLINKENQMFQLFNIKNFDFQLMKAMLFISFPIVIQYLLGLGSWFLFFSFIESKGVLYLAASNVVKNIYSFLGIFAWGLAPVVNTLVSQALGENKDTNIFGIILKVIKASMIFTVPLLILLLVFTRPILFLFTNNVQVIETAFDTTQMLTIIVFSFSISCIVFNAIGGTGATWYAMLFEVIAVVFYLIYAVYFIKIHNCSLPIAWLSEIAYWSVLFILSFWLLKSQKWRGVKI
jgi:MATE family multidrug resistance protein